MDEESTINKIDIAFLCPTHTCTISNPLDVVTPLEKLLTVMLVEMRSSIIFYNYQSVLDGSILFIAYVLINMQLIDRQ